MDIGIISVRYARALYKFALEQKEEHTVYKEMETIAKVYTCEPKLRLIIENPSLTSEQKENILSSWLFQKTGQTSCSLSQTPTYLCIWKKKTF